MIDESMLEAIPCGSRRIFLARIVGDIVKIRYKKTVKEKFTIYDVYKQDSERDNESYFMKNMFHALKLDKNDESFKINEITKIKYIGFSLPDVK